MRFFKFESFISTTLVKIVFVLGVVMGVIGYLAGIAVALVNQSMAQLGIAVVGGAIMFAIGLLLWRVYCELAIVLFRIYEELEEFVTFQKRHSQSQASSRDEHTHDERSPSAEF